MSRVWTLHEAVKQAVDEADGLEPPFDFVEAFLDALELRGFEIVRADR